MKFPFVSSRAFSRLESYSDTEIWSLKREAKRLRERMAASVVCVEKLEERNLFLERERERLLFETRALEEERTRYAEENRELRRRMDLVRADLSRARHENTELKLMKDALEARIAAPCEV